jgi:large subunit ribosomal protein L29
MKAEEIKLLSDTDLEQSLKDARTELFNLRFQLATGQLDNTGRIKAVKKDIARVLTEMRVREIEAAKDAAASS